MKSFFMRNHILKQHIHRVVVQDTTVIHTEKILQGVGRFQAIEQGPDGFIKVECFRGFAMEIYDVPGKNIEYRKTLA